MELTRNHQGVQFANNQGLPIYCGEFGPVFNGAPEDRPSRLRGLEDQIEIFEQLEIHWSGWTYKDVGVMGWLNLDPESPYMRIIAPFEEMKRYFHCDCWMYWLPGTRPKERLGELANDFVQMLDPTGVDSKKVQGNLVRAALGGVIAEEMLIPYARSFQDCSEVELDEILQSFALKNCLPNPGVLEIVKKFLKPQES